MENPKDFRDEISEKLAEKSNNLAIVQDDYCLTYQQLQDLLSIHRHNLSNIEIIQQRGERRVVAIVAYRTPELIINLLSVWLEGYVSIVLNPKLSNERIISEINNAHAAHVLVEDQLYERINSLSKDLYTNKLSFTSIKDLKQSLNHSPKITSRTKGQFQFPSLYIAYSSGSTGKPKALLNTANALKIAVDASVSDLELKPGVNVLLRSTTDFDGFYLEVMMTLMSGATLVIPGNDNKELINYEKFSIDKQIHVIILTPTLALPIDPTKTPIKTVVLTGEKPSTTEMQRWLRAGKRVVNGYGLVQDGVCTTMHICSLQDEFRHGASIGTKAIPGKKIFIINDSGVITETGPGQLCVSGGGIAEGYYINGRIQQELPNNLVHENNWKCAGFTTLDGAKIYKTGETAINENGHYYIQGRLDYQFQIAGQTVIPEPIEDNIHTILTQRCNIQEPLVYVGPYGLNDKTYMQVCIFAKNQDNLGKLSYMKICQFMYDILPSRIFYKLTPNPSEYLTSNEKKDRNKISQLLDDQTRKNQQVMQLPYTEDVIKVEIGEMIRDVQILIAELLGLDNKTLMPIDTPLKYLGLTSDVFIRLILRLENQFSVELALWRIPKDPTIASLAKHVANCQIYRSTIEPYTDQRNQTDCAVVYLIHPVSGVTIDYHKSALIQRLINLDIRVMFCCAPLLIKNASSIKNAFDLGPPESLTEQTDYLADAIGNDAKEKPIYIIGWSFGGILACEIAEKLHQRKHIIQMTAVIDSVSPQSEPYNQPDAIEKFFEVTENICQDMMKIYSPLAEYFKKKPEYHADSIAQQIKTIADEVINILERFHNVSEKKYLINKIQTARFCVLGWLNYTRQEQFSFRNTYLYTCKSGLRNPFRSEFNSWQRYHPSLQHFHLESATHFDVLEQKEFVNLISDHIEANQKYKNRIIFGSEDQIIGQLPVSCQFVGREDELATLARWMKSAQSVEYYNIYGLGGSGKTQMISKFIREYSQYFPGRVYVLNAESHVSLYAAYRTIGTYMNVDLSAKNLYIQIKNMLTQSLGRWLLVVDNVKDLQLLQTYQILELNQSIAQGCMVILISRIRLQLSKITNNYLQIDKLTSSACERYIQEMTHEDNNSQIDNIKVLAKELSYFPLAVSQACGYINCKALQVDKYTVREYLHDYRLKRKELNVSKMLHDIEYGHSVAVTWMMTQELIECTLKKKQHNLDLLVRYLAYLDPDYISSSLFKYIAREVCIENYEKGVDICLETLSKYCALNSQKTSKDQMNYSVHRLIQDMIFDRLPFEQQIVCLNLIIKLLQSDDQDFKNYSHDFATRFIRSKELGDFQYLRQKFPKFSGVFQLSITANLGELPDDEILQQRQVLSEDLPLIACVDRMIDRCFTILKQFFENIKQQNDPPDDIILQVVTLLKLASDLIESVRFAYKALDLAERCNESFIKIAEFLADLVIDDNMRAALLKSFDRLDEEKMRNFRFTATKFCITYANIVKDPGMAYLSELLFAKDPAVPMKNQAKIFRLCLADRYDYVGYFVPMNIYSICGRPQEALDRGRKWIDCKPNEKAPWRHYIDLCCYYNDYVKLYTLFSELSCPLSASTAIHCMICYQVSDYSAALELSQSLNSNESPLNLSNYLFCLDESTREVFKHKPIISTKLFALFFQCLAHTKLGNNDASCMLAKKAYLLAEDSEDIQLCQLVILMSEAPHLAEINQYAQNLATKLLIDNIQQEPQEDASSNSQLANTDQNLAFLTGLITMSPQEMAITAAMNNPELMEKLVRLVEVENPKLAVEALAYAIITAECTTVTEDLAVCVSFEDNDSAKQFFKSLLLQEQHLPDVNGAYMPDDQSVLLSSALYNGLFNDPYAFDSLLGNNKAFKN